MYVQSTNDYIVQSVQNTGTSANNVQDIASDSITVEDTVTISSEALEASTEGDLEDISFKDYLATYSDLEKNSFWASLESKLKPSYFVSAEAYNTNVADQAAEQLVAEASSQGFNLDLDEAKNFIERKCHVDMENNLAEAVEMGWIEATPDDGLDLELIQVTDYLTDEDRAILEAMYLDAEENGLDTEQIDMLALITSLQRYVNENSEDGDTFALDKAYLERIMEGIRLGGYQKLDAGTIEHLIANYGEYSTSTA